MGSTAPVLNTTLAPPDIARRRLGEIALEVTAGRIIPYLGPGLLDLSPAPPVPSTPVALAMALHERVPVGSRLRGNMWGTAQFIEQRRHRKSLVAFLADIFATPVVPGALHEWLARLQIPLIVDTWYDGAAARAFREAGRTDFVEVQGVTRALETRDIWTKTYDAQGHETSPAAADQSKTIIYEPHGSIAPAQNFLVADSDYVEVLTEIDIQSPIPDVVKSRRKGRGFLFIGCRFDDQMLRTYARQIMKRSGGPSYIVLDFAPTRMEERFLAELGIEPFALNLADAVDALTQA
ncbi:MAG: SIR2 family protein [Hyphomicrobiaceae bacterium]|nr:SIR2 family protein [Hyphomicrobiaceae bacterium]MCC0006554.1 SIR2 family protein [Hyphomicrobiaceae bacterium]